MSVQGAGRPTGLWGRVGRVGRRRDKRVRFRQAVPVRRDRRDLRRQFRLAARLVVAERKAEAVAHLQRLSAGSIPLSDVAPGARDKERIVEFFDGTRLLFTTHYDSSNLKRLMPGPVLAPVWLAQVRPSFTRRWFRLWFASAGQPGLLEVIAAVTPAPAMP